jgi:hypothetical protein
MEDFSYIGVGKISMRVRGASAGLIPIGNCSALAFAISESTKDLKDYTQAGGGTWNETQRIDGIETSFTAHDLSPENLAKALLGEASAITAGTVTDEAHVAYAGALVMTDYPLDIESTVTVEAQGGVAAIGWVTLTAKSLGAYGKPTVSNGLYYKATVAGTTGASQPTWPTTVGATVVDGTVTWTCMGKIVLVAATDYTAAGAGVYLTDAASVTDGENLVIDYTKLAGNVIQALVGSAQEYELVFDGLNEARSGKPVIVQVFRQKLGATKSLSLIGEDYAALEFSGKALKDSTKTGVGVSQYFKVTVVD